MRQLKRTGGFDEHKVMLGFHSIEEAEAAYRAAYDDGANDPATKAVDRVDEILEMTLPELKEWAYKARQSAVHLNFPVRANKETPLRRDGAGQPILRLIASGTKLDATSGIDEEGRDVIGEKVAPILLQKMVEQAKGAHTPQQQAAGGIYFIESHETTMPYGWVFDAGLEDLADGNQQLWCDVRLDLDNPMVPFLIKKFENGEYEPDCSVGLKVIKGTIWDPDEGGFVGYLVDGYWEHIAMTKPGHPSFPDATLDDIYLEEPNFVSATKAIVASVRKDIAKETAEKPHKHSANAGKGEDLMDGLKIRAAEPAGEKTANKEGDLHIHPPAAPAAAAAPVPEKVAESEAEAEARKKKEAEAEAAAAFPPAKPAAPAAAAPPAKEPPPPPAPDAKARGTSLKDLREHLGSMKALMEEGVAGGSSPEEFKALMADIMDDVEEACEVADELMGATENGEPAPAGEPVKEAAKDEPAAMEAAKVKEAEADAEARKAKEAEDCKAKEAEDAKKAKEAEAAKAAGAGELVTKSREDRRMRRAIREQNKLIAELVASNKEIKGKLEHLESQPVSRGPARYADPNAFRDRIGAGSSDALVTALKAIPDSQTRDLASRAVAQDYVEGVLARVFPGMPGAPKP